LKRALVGAEPRPDPPTAPQLRKQPEVTPEAEAFLAAPPFLLPDEPSPAVVDPPATPRPPGTEQPPTVTVAPPELADAPGRPRLARGLASFSRSNADREKKFAHLLRDDPSGEKKKPQPPGGRE